MTWANDELTRAPDPAADAFVLEPAERGAWRKVRDSVSAAIGVTLGLAPHVLHHVGFIAGAALVTGAAGNALFFAVGLLFTVPLLRRLHRRFSTWWAPAIAVAVFAGMFSVSAFVIGPAITGDSAGNRPTPTQTPTQAPSPGHSEHHDG